MLVVITDFYDYKELLYVYCPNTSICSYIDEKSIYFVGYGTSSSYFTGFSKSSLRNSFIPLIFIKDEYRKLLSKISISKEFLVIEPRGQYYEVYKIHENNGSISFYLRKNIDFFSLMILLPYGTYLVKHYLILPEKLDFLLGTVSWGKKFISYVIVSKTNSSRVYIFFDTPLECSTPKYVLRMRVLVVPPQYAFLKTYVLLLYPIITIVTLCYYAVKKKITRRSQVTIFVLIFLLLIYGIHFSFKKFVCYTYYSKIFNDSLLSYLTPSLPVTLIVIDESSNRVIAFLHFPTFYQQVPSYQITNKTLPLGFRISLSIPFNKTIRLTDLVNVTALKYLKLFARLMNCNKVGLFIHSSRLNIISKVDMKMVDGVYIIDLDDIDKVFVEAKPLVITWKSITGKKIKIKPPFEEKKFTGFINIGVPVKVSIVVRRV